MHNLPKNIYSLDHEYRLYLDVTFNIEPFETAGGALSTEAAAHKR